MSKQCLFFAEERNCTSTKRKLENDLFTLIQDYGQV